MPGGGVEPDEEPAVTAAREVLEEAGVIGKLGRCLGVFEVSLFLVYYIDNHTRSQNTNPMKPCRIVSINTGPKFSL